MWKLSTIRLSLKVSQVYKQHSSFFISFQFYFCSVSFFKFVCFPLVFFTSVFVYFQFRYYCLFIFAFSFYFTIFSKTKKLKYIFQFPGKHEEKHDDHGMISRHFIRKYMIPDRCIPEKATCSLTSDGVLTITAPSRPEEKPHERPLKIDFIQSEQPKSIENNNSSNEANETNQEATKISAKN